MVQHAHVVEEKLHTFILTNMFRAYIKFVLSNNKKPIEPGLLQPLLTALISNNHLR